MISIFKSKEFRHYIKDLSPIIAPQNPYDMKGLYLEHSLKPPV